MDHTGLSVLAVIRDRRNFSVYTALQVFSISIFTKLLLEIIQIEPTKISVHLRSISYVQ
jgi:hypothetical protein